jgi:hypothetical protein
VEVEMKIAAVLLAALAGLPWHSLSDRDLRALDAAPFDKRAMMGRHAVLGRHRGVRVVADYPCSDLCPQYTVRIIHYDVPPGSRCERIGGASVPRRVPVGIGVTMERFCVPRPIAGRAG